MRHFANYLAHFFRRYSRRERDGVRNIFQDRRSPLPGSGWNLLNAILTLSLAYVIWRSWLWSLAWAIGTLVGVNLLVSGFTRLMIHRAPVFF